MQLYTHVKYFLSLKLKKAKTILSQLNVGKMPTPVSIVRITLFTLLSISLLTFFLNDKNINRPHQEQAASMLGQLPQQMDAPENKQVSKEALQWLSSLKSYDERSLSNEELMHKFKNMSTAYTILCTTASGDLGIRFWSKEAIKYGKLSAGVMEGMMPVKNKKEESEINTRLLIAMGMNYYGGGLIGSKEIALQFEKIPLSHLAKSGYCNNRILMALHNDRIIALPFLEL